MKKCVKLNLFNLSWLAWQQSGFRVDQETGWRESSGRERLALLQFFATFSEAIFGQGPEVFLRQEL